MKCAKTFEFPYLYAVQLCNILVCDVVYVAMALLIRRSAMPDFGNRCYFLVPISSGGHISSANLAPTVSHSKIFLVNGKRRCTPFV